MTRFWEPLSNERARVLVTVKDGRFRLLPE